jgi:hypothetical protein
MVRILAKDRVIATSPHPMTIRFCRILLSRPDATLK